MRGQRGGGAGGVGVGGGGGYTFDEGDVEERDVRVDEFKDERLGNQIVLVPTMYAYLAAGRVPRKL
jgi:hypothetical protein